MLGRILSISLRIILHPAPQVNAGILKGEFRLEAELGIGAGGVGREIEHIPRATTDNFVRQFSTHRSAEGSDHLEDRRAFAGP